MIKTLFLHPLGPSLILALGGFLLLPLGRLKKRAPNAPAHRLRSGASPHAYPWWSLLAYLILVTAGAALLMLRGEPQAPTSLQWAWQPLTVAGSALSWRLDGWNWLAALLILCATAGSLALLGEGEVGQPDQGTGQRLRSDRVDRTVRTLWLAAAAIAFVTSDNLVTLAGCWVALDAVLALRLQPGWRAQPAGRAWGGLSFAGLLLLAALVFQGEVNAQTSLSTGPFKQPVMALLWVAALARAGVYPLHLWLFGEDHATAGVASGRAGVPAGDWLALHLVCTATGIWLFGRVLVVGPAWLHRPEWAGLGVLALIGTALAAWASPVPDRAWRWIAVNRVSLVILTAYVGGMAGLPIVATCLVTVVLGAGLLAVGQALHRDWRWSLPAWLGALALWGLPGTPGFLARSALVLPVRLDLPDLVAAGGVISAGAPLFLLILIAETLLAAALWHAAGGTTAGRAKARRAHAAKAVALGLNGHAAAMFPSEETAPGRQAVIPLSASDEQQIAVLAGEAVQAEHRTRHTQDVGALGGASETFKAAPPAAIAGGHTGNGLGLDVNGRPAPPFPEAARNGTGPHRRETLRSLPELVQLAVVAALLAVPIIAWGLWPRQLAALAGLAPGSLPATVAEVIAGTRRSAWIGLIIAGMAGCALGWLRPLIFTGMRGWQEGALAIVSLEWAYRAVGFGLRLAGSGLRYFARLGEGEGYVGWLVLAALILWVLLRS